MKNITLTNDYHKTSVTVRVPDSIDGQSEAWMNLQAWAGRDISDKRRVQKIRKTLCGMSDCQCGTVR